MRISESIRAYAYLILTSQVSARASIVENTASALTVQQVYLNNFKDIVNRRVDLQADIKRYQDTLNYASSKVDYSMGEELYMLPSDMNLRIKHGVTGYNNEILVSNGLALGKNDVVNVSVEDKHPHTAPRGVLPVPKTQTHTAPRGVLPDPKTQMHTVSRVHDPSDKATPEEEKIALVLFWWLVSRYGACLSKAHRTSTLPRSSSQYA